MHCQQSSRKASSPPNMTASRPIRVVIADDHALFRQGLKSLLKLHAEIEVVGEAECVADVWPLLTAASCDLLLLDLGMERNTIADITTLAAQVPVVVVTACEQAHEAAAAVRAGAR